jgi:hypothetical protein
MQIAMLARSQVATSSESDLRVRAGEALRRRTFVPRQQLVLTKKHHAIAVTSWQAIQLCDLVHLADGLWPSYYGVTRGGRQGSR